MRRFRWLILLLLVLSLGFGVVYRPPPPRPRPVAVQPVPGGGLRFHRPPASVAPPAASTVAPSAEPAAPRELTLEALSPSARSTLYDTAMARLRELSATCDDRLEAPLALGAFATLDDQGLVELELHPIVPDGGPIQALDELLPEAYADCVEDLLWSQDWGVADLPPESELKVALTTRAD